MKAFSPSARSRFAAARFIDACSSSAFRSCSSIRLATAAATLLTSAVPLAFLAATWASRLTVCAAMSFSMFERTSESARRSPLAIISLTLATFELCVFALSDLASTCAVAIFSAWSRCISILLAISSPRAGRSRTESFSWTGLL